MRVPRSTLRFEEREHQIRLILVKLTPPDGTSGSARRSTAADR